MKEGNIVLQKAFAFAVEVIKVCRFIRYKKSEFVLSKRLLRSGTSIGANIEEAVGAQSPADFYAKITIAYKEARETLYWIRLLNASELLSAHEADPLLQDIREIIRILAAIQLTLKSKRWHSSHS